jgi:hypothetical protein
MEAFTDDTEKTVYAFAWGDVSSFEIALLPEAWIAETNLPASLV